MRKKVRLFTWRSAIADSDLRPCERHVALTLSLHMSERGDQAYPSVATLADETGLSGRSVQRSLDAIEAAGYLEPFHRDGTPGRSVGGRGQTTIWVARVPGGEAPDPPSWAVGNPDTDDGDKGGENSDSVTGITGSNGDTVTEFEPGETTTEGRGSEENPVSEEAETPSSTTQNPDRPDGGGRQEGVLREGGTASRGLGRNKNSGSSRQGRESQEFDRDQPHEPDPEPDPSDDDPETAAARRVLTESGKRPEAIEDILANVPAREILAKFEGAEAS